MHALIAWPTLSILLTMLTYTAGIFWIVGTHTANDKTRSVISHIKSFIRDSVTLFRWWKAKLTSNTFQSPAKNNSSVFQQRTSYRRSHHHILFWAKYLLTLALFLLYHEAYFQKLKEAGRETSPLFNHAVRGAFEYTIAQFCGWLSRTLLLALNLWMSIRFCSHCIWSNEIWSLSWLPLWFWCSAFLLENFPQCSMWRNTIIVTRLDQSPTALQCRPHSLRKMTSRKFGSSIIHCIRGLLLSANCLRILQLNPIKDMSTAYMHIQRIRTYGPRIGV